MGATEQTNLLRASQETEAIPEAGPKSELSIDDVLQKELSEAGLDSCLSSPKDNGPGLKSQVTGFVRLNNIGEEVTKGRRGGFSEAV